MRFCLVGLVVGFWVARNPDVQASIAAPDQIRQLVDHDFEDYYSSHPGRFVRGAGATNNAIVTAMSLFLGPLILPVVWILWQNALNVGIAGGLMAGAGRLDLFFGLILPHGLLELTCVFIAAGAGLRLGWTWIDPGPRTRRTGDGRRGPGRRCAGHRAGRHARRLRVHRGIRHALAVADLGAHRHRASVWLAFLTYIFVLGRRAALAGSLGDVEGAGAATCAAHRRLTGRIQQRGGLRAGRRP